MPIGAACGLCSAHWLGCSRKRARLAADFLSEIASSFDIEGARAIIECRENNPLFGNRR
jgi:hypothetical protein